MMAFYIMWRIPGSNRSPSRCFASGRSTIIYCMPQKNSRNFYCGLWRIPGSNRSPFACHANALPDELIPHLFTGEQIYELNQ